MNAPSVSAARTVPMMLVHMSCVVPKLGARSLGAAISADITPAPARKTETFR
jgi:hypothetical protein